MKTINGRIGFALVAFFALVGPRRPTAAEETAKVTVSWDKVIRVSKTTPTLQVVVNPPLRRGSAIHDGVFKALADLRCDYVRYVPWLPYPKLGVAELDPPADGKTSWDFSLIDPMTKDFLQATEGHPVVINFSTIPQWMFKTDKPVPYPADPDHVTWNYEQGSEFRDPSLREVADYFGRLASWHTQGGFNDEFGRRHDSGHHYKIDYWEILNEVEAEHDMTPQAYTRFYDAVVAAVRRVQPKLKFVGMALEGPSRDPQWFEYFLNPANHLPGTPLDMISYHFYAHNAPDEPADANPFTFFEQADKFLDSVRYIEAIRQRLSPSTRTTVNEIGSIYSSDSGQGQPGYVFVPPPARYWNLSGAVYAYVFAGLALQGIEVAGESQLVGYPTQYPSVSLLDWRTGQPNARYWVLKLLHDNFGPGDELLQTDSSLDYVYAQGFLTRDGRRKILLVNERHRAFEVTLPDADGAEVQCVDQTTGLNPPVSARLTGSQATLGGFAVCVVTLAK